MRSNAWFAEIIGTFTLVFIGCGTVIAHVKGGSIGLPVNGLGVAFAFGLAVTAMAYAIGRVSGCHLNPAVTFGLAVGGRFAWKDVPTYWLSQALGATSAAGALQFIFGDVANLGATLPAADLSVGSLMLAEALATALFVFVIFAVTDAKAPHPALAPLAIGLALGLGLLVLGPITGGSMNPARSLGPALVAGVWDQFHFYVLATLAGGAIGAYAYQAVDAQPKSADAPEPVDVEAA